MQQFNRREKYMVANTLNFVPIVLQGQSVLIDLLNENSVAGRISNADGLMNINLQHAVFIDRDGNQHYFEEFMVRSRVIRQIQIPNNVDMEQEIQHWMQHGLKQKPNGKKTGKRTFKQKRAEERHKDTVQEIINSKSSSHET